MAQAFQVIECVVQEVPVFVVYLTAAFRSASFTWLKGLQSPRVFRSGATRHRMFPHGRALAGKSAIAPNLEHIHVFASDGWVRRILMFCGKHLQAHRASLGRVGDWHFLPSIIDFHSVRMRLVS
jgi:hypothetical protein